MRIGNNSQGIWQLLSRMNGEKQIRICLSPGQGVPVRAAGIRCKTSLPDIGKILMVWKG